MTKIEALEKRVNELEKEVAKLAKHQLQSETRKKDWRRTVGAFKDDAIMKKILEEGRKIREADRKAARR